MTKPVKSLITKSVELPAEALEYTVITGQKALAKTAENKLVKKTGDYWHLLGPGLTTGASDDDPSGIATYSQAGSQFGFQTLWLSVVTFPLMGVVQEMCARIGLVTGRGLAGNIRVFFSRRLLMVCTFLLFAANAFNIGADLGAMAKAVQLLNGSLNFSMLVIGFGVFSLLLQIFTPYVRYAKYLKWLALVLLSYVASSILAKLSWGEVLHATFFPQITWSKDMVIMLCAILGTTISPYLFFWQTSQEVEEQILRGNTTVKLRKAAVAPEDMKSMQIDVWTGMFLSNAVMFFIIAACGGILFPQGITQIESAAQAAEALRPFAGEATYTLFAVGLIGTGLLAIPVLAGSSSYALAETFRWREGLYRNLGQAYAFYGVIIISMGLGLGLNFVGIDPIKALIYSAIANGLVAPIILFFIVRMSSNHKIMGQYTNKRHTTIIGWATFAVMAVSGVAAIVALFM